LLLLGSVLFSLEFPHSSLFSLFPNRVCISSLELFNSLFPFHSSFSPTALHCVNSSLPCAGYCTSFSRHPSHLFFSWTVLFSSRSFCSPSFLLAGDSFLVPHCYFSPSLVSVNSCPPHGHSLGVLSRFSVNIGCPQNFFLGLIPPPLSLFPCPRTCFPILLYASFFAPGWTAPPIVVLIIYDAPPPVPALLILKPFFPLPFCLA